MFDLDRWTLWSVALAAILLIVTISACQDETITVPEQNDSAMPYILSSGGTFMPRAAMDAYLERVTRLVAIAVADEEIRQQVYRSLQASSVPENKLHFRSFLESDESDLLSRAASAGETQEANVLRMLDNIVDLEFYMPVVEHREVWRGGSNVIVGSVLDDDGTVPFGFDLNGERVRMDADVPPETPTLMIVPVERDYWSDDRYGADVSAAEIGAMSLDGIVMTESTIIHSFEGWGMGAPEFEVHAFARNATTNEYEHFQCAGEHQSSPYQFDQDEDFTWHGDVLLVDRPDAEGEEILLAYWEDDNGACEVPRTGTDISGDLKDAALAALDVLDSVSVERIVKLVGEAVQLVIASQKDDYVGSLEWPPVECWPEASGGIYADVLALDGEKVGYSKLDNTFGDREPLCSLSTTISGPDQVKYTSQMFVACPLADYSASVSGSSGTPSYEWWYDGEFVATGETYTIPNSDLTAGFHQLYIIATRGGEQDTDSKWVEVIDASC